MIRFGFYLLLTLPLNLLAQGFTPNPDWRFENFNSQNHFISREILSLTTDKHGYLWTCSGGVQRFDGNRTVYFNSFDQGKEVLRDNYTSIIRDNDGRVWVSSAGLCYYDEISGGFIYVQPDTKHPIKAVNASFVQKNCIWFVCEYGLAKIDVRSMKISFTSLTTIVDPLCTYPIDENHLLISSREKAYIYNIKDNTWASNTLIYNHSLVKIFTAAKNNNTIFLATNQGLFTFKSLYDISPAADEMRDVEINDLQFLSQDKEKKYLFLATAIKGMKIYNTSTKKVEFSYLHDDNNPYSLPDNVISRFFSDSQGRLWIATGLGVSILDLSNQQWKMRFLNKSSLNGLSINKIALDKYDSSKVWMSSYTQGMVCINWKTKQIARIYNTDPRIRRIYDFTQLSNNKMLLVTQKEAIEWDPQIGILLQNKLPVADSLALVYNIRRIIKVDDHTCYITSNKGLFKYDLDKHKISVASAPGSSTTDPLKYDLQGGFYDNGALWIASRDGLFNYDIANDRTKIYRGKGAMADYFLFDVNGSINDQVVCASGYGLSVFNKKTKTFRVINVIANLLKPHCESVITIDHTLWIGTEVGVLSYDLITHRSARAEQATPLMQFFPSSPFAIAGNDIVLGFSDGYAYFTPSLKDIIAPSDPVIERVYVNNLPVLKSYPDQKSDSGFVFSHLNNSIKIAFTAFLYNDPEHIKFRYRLKGADPNWLYADGERSANYAQLPPGSYHFYVQCGNKNGIWNSNPASFNFIIQPPFWETWWFRMAVIMLIAAVAYNLYRYKIRHLLAIEEIRDSIAADFHDDLGSTLSSISIFSEVAIQNADDDVAISKNMMEDIGVRARAMIHSMNDMVWAIKPENDNLYSLMERMEEFSYPLAEAKEMRLTFVMDESLYNIKTDMLRRKNLFLIFKEAFNNAIKYSNARVIEVSFALKHKKMLVMQVADNGSGFEFDNIKPGDGLNNLQKRANEINGKLKITTAIGCGTTINITCNIT